MNTSMSEPGKMTRPNATALIRFPTILEVHTLEGEPRRFRVGERPHHGAETVERIEAVWTIDDIEQPTEFIVHFVGSDRRRRIPYHGVLDWLEHT